MNSTDERLRIRYGRVNGRSPKNTLVTCRRDKTIFFGISRCNNDTGDAFTKPVGKHIAQARTGMAVTEENEGKTNYRTGPDDIRVHRSGLRGSCSVSNIQSLLEYFGNVDAIHYNLFYGE